MKINYILPARRSLGGGGSPSKGILYFMARPAKKIAEKKNVKSDVKNVAQTELKLSTSKAGAEVAAKPAGRYFEGSGGRKTARARVRIFHNKGEVTVNGKAYKDYFKISKLQPIVVAPLALLGLQDEFSASAHVAGGGSAAQADAVRHGLAQALVKFNPEFKKRLRHAGFVTRDPREVERKKPGLKKARKAPQWAKR